MTRKEKTEKVKLNKAKKEETKKAKEVAKGVEAARLKATLAERTKIKEGHRARIAAFRKVVKKTTSAKNKEMKEKKLKRRVARKARKDAGKTGDK